MVASQGHCAHWQEAKQGCGLNDGQSLLEPLWGMHTWTVRKCRTQLYVTVYGKRDHVPQKLIFSYGLQRHLRKTLAKLRFLAYNTC